MPNSSPTLLIVDDNIDHLTLLARYAEASGHEYRTANTGSSAIEMIRENDFDVIITDIIMPNMDGMELIKFSREHAPNASIIAMTGYSKSYSYTDVIKAGADDFFAKPFSKDEFITKLRRIFRENSLRFHLKQEIEQHQATNAALLLAQKAAEQTNEMKNSFINTISHEFLTPMNSIQGFSELLSDSDLDPKQREFIEMIQKSSDRLMHLINQLLDFSHLAKTREDNQKTFNLRHTINVVFAELIPIAEKKALALSYNISDNVPQQLSGDPAILSRILNDLLHNAITYTSQGYTKVIVELKETQADNILLHFAIQDTGCGIPTSKHKTIFEPFTQADDYQSRSHEGAGLGLAMCRKLVALLKGTLWLDSQVSKGSTFHFTAQFKLP